MNLIPQIITKVCLKLDKFFFRKRYTNHATVDRILKEHSKIEQAKKELFSIGHSEDKEAIKKLHNGGY